MTTFGLDEVVASELLGGLVQKSQRIVIFHDIIKRRFPGVLKAEFANSQVIGVNLQKMADCPIFHSKIWYEVHRGKILRLVAHSFNLTRFHLEYSNWTQESWVSWNGPIQLTPAARGSFIFARSFEKSRLRIKEHPATVVIEPAGGGAVIDLSRHTVGAVLGHLPSLAKGGKVLRAAAPFISKKALEALGAGPNCRCWGGQESNVSRYGCCLHAKIIEYPKRLVLGSANLTRQALHGKHGPINHETVVVVPKPAGFRMERALPGFRGTPLNSLLEIPVDEPGDVDSDDSEIVDWKEERRLRGDAPESARLAFRSERDLVVRLSGAHVRVSQIRLQSTTKETLVLPGGKARGHFDYGIAAGPPSERLAQMFMSLPIIVVGMKSGKVAWKLELDLTDLWLLLRPSFERRGGSSNGGGLKKHRGRGALDYVDVREALRLARRQQGGASPWQRWLAQNSKGSIGQVPAWCFETASLIRREDR